MKSSKKKQVKPQKSEISGVDNVLRDDTPAADWTVERLAAYARGRMTEANELEKMAFNYGRRSVQEFWHAGRALKLIADKLKPEKQWVGWQETCGMSRNRVNQAIRLSQKAKSLDDLKDFDTIREALVHYEIETPRKPATPTKPPAGPPQKRIDQADAKGGHEDEDEATAQKDEEQPPAPPQGTPVPCVKGKLQVERRGKKTTFKLEDVEVRMNRVTSRIDVRIVSRWRADLRLALENEEAVLILPCLEVPDATAG